MFDFKKFFQGYDTVTAPMDRLAIYSPRFGRTARSSISLPLTSDTAAKICILLITSMIIYSGLLTLADFRAMLEEMRMSRMGWMFFYCFRALLISNVIVFLWRILLVLGYRPVRACTDEELPYCTVIVPAYNEGKHVLKTLRSVLKSDYPSNKLQIIAINDGSGDDTLAWIQKACSESAGRIQMINFKKNRGKRAALYEGIVRGKGEIIVTIDSDSLIQRPTIRRLVSPFVSEASVGAVAGNVRVLNRRDGLIPRMLEVSFAYSFDFIGASHGIRTPVSAVRGPRPGPLDEGGGGQSGRNSRIGLLTQPCSRGTFGHVDCRSNGGRLVMKQAGDRCGGFVAAWPYFFSWPAVRPMPMTAIARCWMAISGSPNPR